MTTSPHPDQAAKSAYHQHPAAAPRLADNGLTGTTMARNVHNTIRSTLRASSGALRMPASVPFVKD